MLKPNVVSVPQRKRNTFVLEDDTLTKTQIYFGKVPKRKEIRRIYEQISNSKYSSQNNPVNFGFMVPLAPTLIRQVQTALTFCQLLRPFLKGIHPSPLRQSIFIMKRLDIK
jgi:hypothetical protein